MPRPAPTARKASADAQAPGCGLQWPDQWLAVTDEWADPVAGDSKDAAVIRPMLKQTQLEAVPLGLAYDAKKDGWSHVRAQP